MAKLLWDCLQDAAPSRRERRGMILDVDALTEGARYCGKALAQIKGQLAWVLDSIENIGRVSTAAGPAAWGADGLLLRRHTGGSFVSRDWWGGDEADRDSRLIEAPGPS